MKLAKNYQQYETIGEPYEAHGYWYQKININGQITEARLYNDDEYEKMYPSDLVPIKEQLGFIDNKITILKGNTVPLKDWLAEVGARYNKIFGWYIPGDDPIDPIPEGITPLVLNWVRVSVNNKYLRPDDEIVELVSSMRYGKSTSQFVGEVGQKITANLLIKKVIELNTRYGKTNMHIMEDQEHNVFIWITNSRNLVEGQTYTVTGEIKDHETYKGEKRNVLKRCQIKEI